jgi:hypothetical protein
MSELPREARELLALARDAHDPPDPDARDRVRRGVATAVAVSAGVAISGKAIAAGSKAGLFAGSGAKLVALGGAIVLAGAVAVGAPLIARQVQHERAPVARHARASTPALDAPPAVPAPLEAQPAQAVAQPQQALQPQDEMAAPAAKLVVPEHARASRHVRHARGQERSAPTPEETAATPDELRAEMALLRAASDALTAGQVGVAVQRLDEHAQRFAGGQLGEEREGLRVIARCMRGDRGAGAAAERYLKRHPQSVLAVRASSACKLDGEP